jgi:photosystem II stability/assembly factor-like uncharacterized protein
MNHQGQANHHKQNIGRVVKMLFLTVMSSLTTMRTVALAQWVQQVSSPQHLVGIKAVNNNVVWAVGGAGTFALTTNGGSTWTGGTITGATSLFFYSVGAVDANTAYAVGANDATFLDGSIYKTTNGGLNWTLQYYNQEAFFDGIAVWDANNLVAFSDPVDSTFLVVRTTNGGSNWIVVPATNIPNSLPNEYGYSVGGSAITTQGTSNAWFGTAGAAADRVFRTTDRGVSWSFAVTPLTPDTVYGTGISGITFKDANNGYAISENQPVADTIINQNIARTTDGGLTWTLVSTGLQVANDPFSIAYIPGTNTIVVVGDGSGCSTNNGATWATISAPTPNYIFHGLSFLSATTGWATADVDTAGGFIFRYSGTLAVPVQGSPSEKKFALQQNYPNPFNPSTTISFTIPNAAVVSLKVYDVLGREVATLINGRLAAGTHESIFNASKLSSGVYFYKLQAGDFVQTKKMLLVK